METEKMNCIQLRQCGSFIFHDFNINGQCGTVISSVVTDDFENVDEQQAMNDNV